MPLLSLFGANVRNVSSSLLFFRFSFPRFSSSPLISFFPFSSSWVFSILRRSVFPPPFFPSQPAFFSASTDTYSSFLQRLHKISWLRTDPPQTERSSREYLLRNSSHVDYIPFRPQTLYLAYTPLPKITFATSGKYFFRANPLPTLGYSPTFSAGSSRTR